MSYGIQSKKLRRLVDFYSPFNNGEQLKFLSLFKGEQGLLRYLQASSFQGIDSTSIEQRSLWFGTNRPQIQKQTHELRKVLLSPFNNFAMKVYFLFSIIAFIPDFLNENQEKYAFLGSIFNFTVFTLIFILLLVTELCQYLENKKLKEFIFEGCKVTVWRDNEKKEIDSFDLVIGDVVELEQGSIVGADGIVIEGNLKVREPMCYKQIKVEKCNTKQCLRRWAQFQDKATKFCLDQEEEEEQMPSPIILGGSKIEKGDGKFVVLCVGKHSRVGHFVHEVHRSATEHKSEVQQKVYELVFQLSKYLILSTLLLVILYAVKVISLIIVQKSLFTQNWSKICFDLARGVTIILMGLPIAQIFGLIVGLSYIRFSIRKTDSVWYKYVKDCGALREITTVVFDRMENQMPIRLVKWWNGSFHDIVLDEHKEKESQMYSQDYTIESTKFERMLIQSLKCQNFQPYEVGLKIPSFFIGLNQRYIQYLEHCLNEYADERLKHLQMVQKESPEQSLIEIEDSQEKIHKQIEIIYLKGNSETILKECSHILGPRGNVVAITVQMREKIRGMILKMNSQEQSSLITGYIEVHPNHPKFREPDYKIVMLSLIAYTENHDNLQFESLARMKKMGISVMLTGHCSHDQTVAVGKEMGIVMTDKPSIRLTGYDFHKIVGGIICKHCKKSTCICANEEKYHPVLKNQDEFNRIYKHLNVLSEANSQEKQTLALGFSAAQEKVFFIGRSINDVPAMRISTASAVVSTDIEDDYVNYAATMVLPDDNLATMEKLITWSHFYYEFCRRYIVFTLTPSLVAFISSFMSFLLFNNFCIQQLQFLWVTVVICPLLGMTFVLAGPPAAQTMEKNTKKNDAFIDKINYRQISSQVIIQVSLIIMVLAFGPSFIPEDSDPVDSIIESDWSAKYNSELKQTVCSGIYDNVFNHREEVYARVIRDYGIHSRHMTFIFNLFVIMQFVNYFNCRNLGNFYGNFVEGITLGSVICLLTAVGLQILIIFVGGSAFQLYPGGLTLKQWAICLGLSLIVVLVGLLVKQIPYENENEEQNGKVWPNRCYNLAVMATMPRQSLQDFQIDEQLQVKKMAMVNQ